MREIKREAEDYDELISEISSELEESSQFTASPKRKSNASDANSHGRLSNRGSFKT